MTWDKATVCCSRSRKARRCSSTAADVSNTVLSNVARILTSARTWSLPIYGPEGIRHLDVIAATHAHQDHTGGLRALIDNFHPSELWVAANPPQDLVAQAQRQHIRVVERRESEPFPFSGAILQILAPTRDYISTAAGNNDSLVLRATYGSRSFLLTGDLEKAEEYHMLEPGHGALTADVLKVGHHGSRTSTTEEFLKAVSPSVAIISAGYENSFGHPHPDVVHRLEDAHVAILRTDIDGLAMVRTNGKQLIYNVQSWHSELQRWAIATHLIH